MGDLSKGVEAGFAATIVISILIYIQQMLGFTPDFNLIAMATKVAGGDTIMGWMFHFLIGAIAWGLGFAVVSPHLPGPHWLRGAIFAVIAWVLMMVAFLPAAGLPIFAHGLGLTIPAASLILHLIFGLVLGESYHLLVHYFPGEVEEEKA